MLLAEGTVTDSQFLLLLRSRNHWRFWLFKQKTQTLCQRSCPVWGPPGDSPVPRSPVRCWGGDSSQECEDTRAPSTLLAHSCTSQGSGSSQGTSSLAGGIGIPSCEGSLVPASVSGASPVLPAGWNYLLLPHLGQNVVSQRNKLWLGPH